MEPPLRSYKAATVSLSQDKLYGIDNATHITIETQRPFLSSFVRQTHCVAVVEREKLSLKK